MPVFREGNLELKVPNRVSARRFDGHSLSYCMKAVDFIIEEDERYLFIEFKDPHHPNSRETDRKQWMDDFRAERIDNDLQYKYRDTFLYEWASDRANKSIHYYVLVALDTLTEAELIQRTEALRRKLPVSRPKGSNWRHEIVNRCMVFNVSTWNATFKHYPVNRIS